jgi:hypothetical protein
VQQPTAERGATEAIRCVVPSLEGESLATARHSLRAAHYALGKVSRPRWGLDALVVRGQSPEHGKTLPGEAAVGVKLGLAKHRRH